MLDLQRLFNDFENLTNLLRKRGISKENLILVKQKLVKQRELTKVINNQRQKRNLLSQGERGQENAEKVKKIKEEIVLLEKQLSELEKGLNNLTSQLPNFPAPGTPNNEEGNRIIDNTKYQHNIEHNLIHEAILKNNRWRKKHTPFW